MTREEAKKLLPVLQAYAEGKVIQSTRKGFKEPWTDKVESDWDFNCKHYNYRIKPEPKYRPFKSAEECWQEMQKHQPFGWAKISYGYFNIIGIKENAANLGEIDNFIDYKYLYENCTFADGTPFGIKEEDNA